MNNPHDKNKYLNLTQEQSKTLQDAITSWKYSQDQVAWAVGRYQDKHDVKLDRAWSYTPPWVNTVQPAWNKPLWGVSTQDTEWQPRDVPWVQQAWQPQEGSVGSILTWISDSEQQRVIDQYLEMQRQEATQNIWTRDTAYQEELKRQQARIDASSAVYNDQLNEARRAWDVRMWSERALQSRRGMLWSSFANSAMSQQQQGVSQEQREIHNRKILAQEQIFDDIRGIADETFRAKQAAKLAWWAEYARFYLETVPKMKLETTQRVANRLLDNNIDPNSLTDTQLEEAWILRWELEKQYRELKQVREIEQAEFTAFKNAEERKSNERAEKLADEERKRENTLVEFASKMGIDPTGLSIDELLANIADVTVSEKDTEKLYRIAEYAASYGIDPTWMTVDEVFAEVSQEIKRQTKFGEWLKTSAWTSTTGGNSIDNAQWIIWYSINKRWRENLQCWEFVNDAWEYATGQRFGIGDSYDSKIQAIKIAWQSDWPVVWWVFAFPATTFAWNTWHTGIVRSVNSDGSIEVLEANREGTASGSTPKIGKYSAEQVKNMIFSQAPETNIQTVWYNESYAPDYTAYNQKWMTDSMRKGLISRWINPEQFVVEAKNYKYEKISETAEQYINYLKHIMDADLQRGDRLAMMVPGAKIIPKYADTKSYIDSIRSRLNLDALLKEKAQGATFWQLSNQELDVLWRAATALEYTMSQDGWNRELAKIWNVLLKASGKKPIFNEKWWYEWQGEWPNLQTGVNEENPQDIVWI
jgi:hypothetical protein